MMVVVDNLVVFCALFILKQP